MAFDFSEVYTGFLTLSLGAFGLWAQTRFSKLEKKQDDCEKRHIDVLKDNYSTKLELTEVKTKMETMSSFEEIKAHIIEGVVEAIQAVTCPLKGGCDNKKDTN